MSRSPATTPPQDARPPVPHPDAPGPGTVLASHYDDCFGCGKNHPTGLHLKLIVGQNVSVAARFTVTTDHQGAPGLAHGGLLAAAMDETLGAVAWLLRRPMVTARLETDYLKPVPVGSTVTIQARCTWVAGRKTYVEAEGRLAEPAETAVARAAALFVAVPLEHFTTYGNKDAVEEILRRRYDVNP